MSHHDHAPSPAPLCCPHPAGSKQLVTLLALPHTQTRNTRPQTVTRSPALHPSTPRFQRGPPLLPIVMQHSLIRIGVNCRQLQRSRSADRVTWSLPSKYPMPSVSNERQEWNRWLPCARTAHRLIWPSSPAAYTVPSLSKQQSSRGAWCEKEARGRRVLASYRCRFCTTTGVHLLLIAALALRRMRKSQKHDIL